MSLENPAPKVISIKNTSSTHINKERLKKE